MLERIQARLDTLKAEFEMAQVELQKVENQRTYLHETVLRIAGAMQVLEELLREEQPDEHSEAGPGETQAAATTGNGADAKQTS